MRFVVQGQTLVGGLTRPAGAQQQPSGGTFDTLWQAALTPLDELEPQPIKDYTWTIIGTVGKNALPPEAILVIKGRAFLGFLTKSGHAIVEALNGVPVQEITFDPEDVDIEQQQLEDLIRTLDRITAGDVGGYIPPMQYRDP